MRGVKQEQQLIAAVFVESSLSVRHTATRVSNWVVSGFARTKTVYLYFEVCNSSEV